MSWFGGLFKASAADLDQPETRHRGASRMLRSMARWMAQIGDAPSDANESERRTLRARSRDAYRNQPIARGVVSRGRNSIVGTGLMSNPDVDAAILGLTKDQAREKNAEIRRWFNLWADSPAECDIEGIEDFYGSQAIALVSSMCSGDVLVSTPQVDGGVFLTKVQLIEADRISNRLGEPNSARLIDGVSLAPGGRHLGYYVSRHHPGSSLPDTDLRWDFISAEARRAWLLYDDRDRPGTVRGTPYLAPILEPLRKIDQWSRAELTAAVVSAMFTVFIEKEKERGVDAAGNPLGPFGPEEDSDDPAPIDLGEGAVVDLAPGEKASFANPNRPNGQFSPFFVAMCDQIGSALGVPRQEILLVYEESYSAARAAMLQAWRFFMMRRWRLVVQFCQPVYDIVLDELVASARISLPGYGDPIKRRAWKRCIWNGPARGSIDEKKEAEAALVRIKGGLSNEAIEVMAATGEDRDSVYQQRLTEVQERKADGTYLEQVGKVTEEKEPVEDTTDD